MTESTTEPRRASARFYLRMYAGPVLVALIQVIGTFGAARGQPERAPLDWLGVLLLLAGPTMLLARQRRPVPVLYGVIAVTLAYVLLGYPFGPFMLSSIVALVAAVRYGHRLAAWLAVAVLVVGHYALGQLLSVPGAPSLTELPLVGGWLIAILVGAEVWRSQSERKREQIAAREAEAASRLTEERLRIARELHDVVAHNISLINVQAGAALHLIEVKPEQARTALTAIKQASKEALVELRSILGVLRQVDEPGPRKPTPGLARLDELADRARQAGQDLTVRIVGERRPVPSAVDVAAYRIVQEALTNVLRHAEAKRVEIVVTYADASLGLEITDNGRGAATGSPGLGSPGSGSGLIGMRERVAALDGTLEAGARSTGGFRIYAELPTSAVPRTATETATEDR